MNNEIRICVVELWCSCAVVKGAEYIDTMGIGINEMGSITVWHYCKPLEKDALPETSCRGSQVNRYATCTQ